MMRRLRSGSSTPARFFKKRAEELTKGKVKVEKHVDKKADFVGAIVFYDDPAAVPERTRSSAWT